MKLKWILLYCYKNIKGERTASSIYHLLKGKRSIQTVQDAHIYHLNSFYGIHKNITKDYFNQQTELFILNGLLEEIPNQESTYVVTDRTLYWIENNPCGLTFHGLTYLEKTDIFINRLVLLIQTLANSKKNYFSFIPVIEHLNTELWVKQVYRKVKGKEHILLERIHNELYQVLNQFQEKEAAIFVDRLTGYKIYGLSLFQLAKKYKMPEDDIHLYLVSVIHRILMQLEINQSSFPTLWLLIRDQITASKITKSANKTYQYLKKGYTVDQIAVIRNLKENTIYDHIVELALYMENFPIQNYVGEKEQNEIRNALIQAKSYKLKDIKDLVSEQISYFQIRLTIALDSKLMKQGDENASNKKT